MKTKFADITPSLITPDIEGTIYFYVNKLGFTVLKTIPEKGQPDWVMLKRNNVILMFQRVNLSNVRTGCHSLYIRVENIRPFHDEVEQQVEIVSALEHTFYDTLEFSILDNNGYLITFAEFLK